MPSPVSPHEVSLAFGVPAEAVTAYATVALTIATVILSVATIALVYVAREQLPLLTKQIRDSSDAEMRARLGEREARDLQVALEAKRDRRFIEASSIRACERYMSDVVLYQAAKRIWRKSEGGNKYDLNNVDEHDLIIVFNYLDSIAKGVLQGVFDETIVKDLLSELFVKAVDIVIPACFPGDKTYKAMRQLRSKWDTPVKVNYKHNPPDKR
jgi:hypothetical protein